MSSVERGFDPSSVGPAEITPVAELAAQELAGVLEPIRAR